MSVTEVKTYRVTCDRDSGVVVPRPRGSGPWLVRPGIDHQSLIVHAKDEEDLNKQLAKEGWVNGNCEWCSQAQRPPDIAYEDYHKLTDEEKQARLDQFDTYAARFGPGEYPIREQYNSDYQHYADRQRAEGYGPPGIYT